jgi:hypothetical protein
MAKPSRNTVVISATCVVVVWKCSTRASEEGKKRQEENGAVKADRVIMPTIVFF